jgi:glyoxylase-like metal-dependent hydrolase (beta-lactamase superfamily II)
MNKTKATKYEHVTDNTYTIETLYLGRERYAACYLVEDNGELAIVETNTNYAAPRILDTIDQLGFDKKQVKYVILTHIHLDHAGGAGELMSRLPEAQLVLHPRGRKHMINPEKLIKSVKEVYGEDKYHELYGEIKPIPKERVQIVNAGDFIELGGRKLEVFDMSGHAKHHITILDHKSKSLFSGDNFGIGYPIMSFNNETRLVFPSTTPTQFEPDRALETYEAIMNIKPARILLTHYGRYENISHGYVQLKNWIRFSLEAVEKRYGEGFREAELENVLEKDLWDHFEKEVSGARGSGLTQAEKDLLDMDTRLNAQGLAFYINKLKG